MQQQMQKKTGYLDIICGPMFSGKSEELIRRIRRMVIARRRVIVFKPSIDTRYTLDHVVSHNGSRVNACIINDVNTILTHPEIAQADVVGIDEVQFFPQDIIPIICTLIDQGKQVVVAGLDLDFRGVPFGCMPLLLAIADNITKLRAVCIICGTDAHFTQRLVNNAPARYEDPIIMIGAQEAYQARCRACYSINTPAFARHEQI